MIHEQATDQPCPEQARHCTPRRCRRPSGMIKPLVLQINCSAWCSRSRPHEPRAALIGGMHGPAAVPLAALTLGCSWGAETGGGWRTAAVSDV